MNALGSVRTPDNIAHWLQGRERGRRQSQTDYPNYLVRANIAAERVFKTIRENAHEPRIYGLDVQGNRAATTSLNAIKLWDLESGKCLWTHAANPREQFPKVYIAQERVICSGSTTNPDHPRRPASILSILDIHTGDWIKSIVHPRLEVVELLVTKDEIVGWFNNQRIARWVLDLDKVPRPDLDEVSMLDLDEVPMLDTIDTGDIPAVRFLMASDDFIVFAPMNNSRSKCFLSIYNKEFRFTVPQLLNFEPPESPKYSCLMSAYLHEDLLFCGFTTSEHTPDCCVVDLKADKVTPYRVARNLVSTSIVMAIAGNEQSIYLGYFSGEVVALDRGTRQAVVLGEHTDLNELRIQDRLLISASNALSVKELKFWDTKTKTELGTQRLPEHFPCMTQQFTGTKVVAASGASLITWDYLSTQKQRNPNHS